jgi:hypothetical protein
MGPVVRLSRCGRLINIQGAPTVQNNRAARARLNGAWVRRVNALCLNTLSGCGLADTEQAGSLRPAGPQDTAAPDAVWPRTFLGAIVTAAAIQRSSSGRGHAQSMYRANDSGCY